MSELIALIIAIFVTKLAISIMWLLLLFLMSSFLYEWCITPNFSYIPIDTKHEPPDLLYLDPELLSTLNSPRTSIDSIDDSTTEAAAMMDDWQMHEVFQDISDILKVCNQSIRCDVYIHVLCILHQKS